MKEAIALSRFGIKKNEGGPFGCVVVKNDVIIARAYNKVISTNDPTAHAEIVAIRNACKKLKAFQLDGCEIYTSCEPCPMCLGAIYWARLKIIYFANTKNDATNIGFDDSMIYDEINTPIHQRKIPLISVGREDAQKIFVEWVNKKDKPNY
ncbi:MAG: nucleoside deaminase [Bacteroidota bacterium]|nr:nucleoside deaminase [Bacteroidota bacterium]